MSESPLFSRFPLMRIVDLSTGPAPCPYQVYDGFGLFIGGSADLWQVRSLLADENVYPVETRDHRAVVGIWVCNFTQASLGPHHELQISFFVSREETVKVKSGRLCAHEALFRGRDIQILSHGLWNNREDVIAYNREVLSLNARPCQSRIERDDKSIRFMVLEPGQETPILSGAIGRAWQGSLGANVALVQRFGVARVVAADLAPWLEMGIINPVGVSFQRNRVAQAFNKNKVNRMRFFDQRSDHLVFGPGAYAGLDFTPGMVQSMDGIQFVYLEPGQRQVR